MQAAWRIGSLFGIPLFIDHSWFYILVFVTYLNAISLYRVWGLTLACSAGLVMALLLFGSVLLHELGHSLVALKQGIKVNSITLFLFGGVASIDKESKTPGEAFQVAIAGPMVSLLLSGLFYGLTNILPVVSIGNVLVNHLAYINLVLALFNLIPGLPLDGGQVLKALVWKLTGNRFQGVRWAAKSGQVLGWVAVALGVTVFLADRGDFGGLWLALIGWFISRNASNYDRMATLQEVLLKVQAADAMTRDFRVVDADMTLRQFADEYILADAHTLQVYPYYAASDGRYRGLVSVENLHFIERSRWDVEPLQTIVLPLTEIVSVPEKTALAEVINCLEAHKMKRITVLSPAGTVAGVIDKGDIVRAVASKLKLVVPDAEIKRIKAEGTYPLGLPLPAIAKATSPG